MADALSTDNLPDHPARWQNFLHNCSTAASNAQPLWPVGRLTRINGLVMEAAGLKLPLGSTCRIYPLSGAPIEAEVVGFAGEKLYLMPSDDVYGLAPGSKVVAVEPPNPQLRIDGPPPFRRRAIDRAKQGPVGDELLGRVLDGVGRPLDNKGPLVTALSRPLQSRPINPMSRASIHQPLDVGIRAINALLTVGRGQRMGLFAGSGVGKSVLLGMMARYTEADRRTGPRGQGVHRADSRRGRHAARRRRCRPGRYRAADAPAGGRLCDDDRRVFPRPGQTSPVDHGLPDPLRHGAT
jgi:flagellum-specific ATP synthase